MKLSVATGSVFFVLPFFVLRTLFSSPLQVLPHGTQPRPHRRDFAGLQFGTFLPLIRVRGTGAGLHFLRNDTHAFPHGCDFAGLQFGGIVFSFYVMRFIALDTETTGMNRKRGCSPVAGHRIIEIACVEVVDGRVRSTFHSLINPNRSIDEAAKKIHGITDDRVRTAPYFRDIAKDLLDFIGTSTLVIHNAAFDIAFLDKEFRLLPSGEQPICTFHYVDTLAIARSMFPGADNSLRGLCRRFHIPFDTQHGALTDATMLAYLYPNLNPNLPGLTSQPAPTGLNSKEVHSI